MIEQPATTIVGIGASAGGLQALKTLFADIPPDTGLAYVIIVHLSPEQKSHLAELLQPHIAMPVQQVNTTVPLLANHVYVIPPGCNLSAVDTHLRLSELEKQRQQRAPIDHFFRTLAATHDGGSIGIILTGTGSDGTLGLKEIKARRGLTIVQDPNEAEYDGMPQSAIANGHVDLILPLAKIPTAFLNFTATEPKITVPADEDPELATEQRRLLQKIFAHIRARTGSDFSSYKRSTILRRIQRRMQLCQVDTLDDYLQHLRQEPVETQLLADDFLITVTNFFRDVSVFETLEKEVIPPLFQNGNFNNYVRVWSVGCATGEEAYSLAILLLEAAERCETPPHIQVFASDLHERSLTMAREGFFPGDIETDVSPERLRRFFQKEDGGYRVRKELREIIVFAPHNILADPPFSKIDLIACRNLLIYLQREIQHSVIEIFHYALRPNGYLLLGTSETIETSELFQVESKPHCLYRKRNVPLAELRLPHFPTSSHRQIYPLSQPEVAPQPVMYGLLHQHMVERYAPPSLLIGPGYKIVHLSQHAGRYLVHPGGELTSSAFKLVREELRIELRAALLNAQEGMQPVRSRPVSLRLNGDSQRVVLHVRPSLDEMQKDYFLVIFDEIDERDLGSFGADPSKGINLTELESELDITRDRLQAIIEKYETGQEEMKASNEELQSMNEELRSTLEELETSKEELQSMNEELATLNQENRHKVEELSQLSSDLQNLLTATDIATLFLDRSLRIMRFTPRIGELFNVRSADRGRPLTDLTHRLGYDQLPDDAQQVLNKLQPVQREVVDDQGRWYLSRVLPYRSTDDRIEGVVITFVDITALKSAESALRESEERFRALVEPWAQAVWETDAQGSATGDSPSWRAFTGQSVEEWQGEGWMNAVHPDDRARVLQQWQSAIRQGQLFNTEFRLQHLQGDWRWTNMRAAPLTTATSTPRKWVVMNIDISDRKSTEAALRESAEHLRLILQSASNYAIFTLATNDTISDWNAGAERIFGYSREEIIGQDSKLLTESNAELEQEKRLAIRSGKAESEGWHLRRDGSRFWGSGMLMPLRSGKDELRGFLKIIIDSTDRRQMEEELRRAKNDAEQAARAKEDFLAHMSHEIRTPLNAILGLSTLLTEQQPRSDQHDNLQTLKSAAHHLRLLVDDILDFSKLSAGQSVVQQHEVRLAELLENVKRAQQLRAQEQQTEITINLEAGIPAVVQTDGVKLSQVLHNLLGNAVKFTPQGQIAVNVRIGRRKGDTLWLDFEVEDTGIGISHEKLKDIFESFNQADASTARPYEGTGLGLSITKSLLQVLGSQIEVESTLGKGSRFYFTLPVGVGAPAAAPSGSVPLAEAQSLSHLRVLIAEDNNMNRAVFRQFLNGLWKIQLDEAKDGQQAVELAQKQRYDLILLDIRMPEMDGYQAARAIRELGDHNAQVPLIALTADTRQEVENHAESAHFTDIVTKPFDPDELQKKIAYYGSGTRQPK